MLLKKYESNLCNLSFSLCVANYLLPYGLRWWWRPLPPPPLPPPSPRLPDNGLPPAVAVPAVLPFVAPGRHRRLGATRPSFSVSVGCRLSGALVRPGGSSVASEGHLALSTVSESISSTLLEKQLKFPRYNMKCRGKPDTTWTIPRSITFSLLHFMLYRKKSIPLCNVPC